MLLKIFSLLLVANVFLVYSETPPPNDADPVEVVLFYEGLCPYCSKFIKYQMYPAWQKLGKTGILKVNLYAYGNAHASRSGDRWVFRCQHGTRECQLNQLSTCAFNKYNTQDQKMAFAYCIETNPYPSWGSYCLRHIGVDPQPVLDCIDSKEGNQWQKDIGDMQAKLDPRLRYVPWILVDGVHSTPVQSAVQRDMVKYVCGAYKGTKPAECNGYTDEE